MTIKVGDDLKIPQKKIEEIIDDPIATARAIKLIYVTDKQEGITRIRSGKSFSYRFQKKTVKDKEQLKRIRSLVLPPAWENVWICAKENGHLQATGLDAMKRKQYRYHPHWNELRNQTKFYRMLEFGKSLPQIRRQIKKDLSRQGLPKEKVLATVIALMERTCIRIGNEVYEKMYGSVGLTTMKDKHVDVKGGKLSFNFIGKKGKQHNISLASKKLASVVKQCRDIPGKELFQYIDDEGNKQSIDSGMVNDYIKVLAEKEFTTKDFRTWSGTVQSLIAFKEAGEFKTESESKKKIVEVLDKVAEHLGNTRTVCKKYYVHPSIVDMYGSSALQPFLAKLDTREMKGSKAGLIPEEKLLLQILKNLKNQH